MVAGVLVSISNKNVDKIFDYSVPGELIDSIKIGIRVYVPFGNMKLEGFVLELKDTSSSEHELKEIISVIDSDVVLTPELLDLGKWMQEETLSTLISCYQTMLPKALKAEGSNSISIKYDTFYKLGSIPSDIKLNIKQKEIIDLVKEKKLVSRGELLDISSSSLNTLIKKGLLIEEKKEHYRLKYENSEYIPKTLTPKQKDVVLEVISGHTGIYLLYGVTGSGKTEVYMEIIDYYLKQGKGSIVLVPEISLTPQMVQRFRERFGDKIAALHSALSDGEKYDEWRRISRGEATIVIGARSAIFAPIKSIGAIIVDEEQSDSYKQSDPNPRYHAKDVAIERAKYHNCSVVLGSATPSLETMARAQKGVYKLLTLPERINGRSLPEVNIVDMNKEMKKAKGHFSLELIDGINNSLEKKEQIILLLNRRGYATFVSCKNCGFSFKCPNCDITLTYHKSSNTLRCHYCGYGEKVYTKCPKCGEASLSNLGVGTQRIEEELNDLFPNARVLRMDFDTTSKKGSHNKMIESFRNGEYDILLGTQMVAKGLDFSQVTLVGVINADTSLNIPDFRSSETTYALLSQVAGRSGRANKEGKVIIQTFNPDHYAISLVKNNNYLDFYNKEMDIRRQLKYPPYFYICSIRIRGSNPMETFDEALKVKKIIENKGLPIIILGPSSSNLFKINGTYHYSIIIKHKGNSELKLVLEKVIDHYKTNNKIKVDLDFNPSQMM